MLLSYSVTILWLLLLSLVKIICRNSFPNFVSLPKYTASLIGLFLYNELGNDLEGEYFGAIEVFLS